MNYKCDVLFAFEVSAINNFINVSFLVNSVDPFYIVQPKTILRVAVVNLL